MEYSFYDFLKLIGSLGLFLLRNENHERGLTKGRG